MLDTVDCAFILRFFFLDGELARARTEALVFLGFYCILNLLLPLLEVDNL